MYNMALGKTLKAMYKLSGKTLTQLSDETDLTVDTINNLFYARIQKPGLAGVNALVKAMGFSIQQLIVFLDENPDISEDCDVTDLFTKYISSAADTNAPVKPAKEVVKGTKGSFSAEIELLNAEHEKQLDRFRATHQRYVEQIQEQHKNQIEQMERHFEKSLSELKSSHAQEIERLDKENTRLRKTGKTLSIAVGIETVLILLLLILDVFNRSVGWFR